MIRLLGDTDAEAYLALRREALADAPLAFTASPEDDVAASVDAVRAQLGRGPDAVIIGAFDSGLVGAVGLHRDRHRKAAHKVHLWGMYVRPAHRHRGVGAALLDAVLAYAATLPGVDAVRLTVSDAAQAARRLYERAGFHVWGTEPEALRYEGRSVIEHHMARRV